LRVIDLGETDSVSSRVDDNCSNSDLAICLLLWAGTATTISAIVTPIGSACSPLRSRRFRAQPEIAEPVVPDVHNDEVSDGARKIVAGAGGRMNLEKVVFGFFVVFAATLNFGFFIGDLGDPELHNSYELYAAVVVNLIATVLKFGDRTQIGAVHLATSLVADLQLIAAALVWGYASYVATDGLTREATASVVSLSGGALMANIVSVVLLVVETVSFQRR
jgi:uncharacterized protein DUF6394